MLPALAALPFLLEAQALEGNAAIVASGLAGAVLTLSLISAAREARAPHDDLPSEGSRNPAGLVWTLVLPPLIALVGCMTALGIFVAGFVRFHGRRSWTAALVCGALAAAPVYALAIAMARPELVTGALWQSLF